MTRAAAAEAGVGRTRSEVKDNNEKRVTALTVLVSVNAKTKKRGKGYQSPLSPLWEEEIPMRM